VCIEASAVGEAVGVTSGEIDKVGVKVAVGTVGVCDGIGVSAETISDDVAVGDNVTFATSGVDGGAVK